jgi:20S proteasome alpha/beta subunit
MIAIAQPKIWMRHPQRKPYTPEKPKGAKAMTIAVGFLCGNGDHLILAADRQVTAQGAYKIRRKKYATNTQQYVDTACLYSGEPGMFSELMQKVEDCLVKKTIVTGEIVQSTIENTLEEMKLRDPFLEPRFWLLAGISDWFESPKLIVFDGKSVFKTNDGVQVIGCGDTSLIHYLSDRLYRPDMTRYEGIGLGAYLIKKATQYIDGCGEPIDMIDGNAVGFEVVKNEEISARLLAIENREELLFKGLL